jgi:outer membrane protein OmpA-like peptidoglycan-associated protein
MKKRFIILITIILGVGTVVAQDYKGIVTFNKTRLAEVDDQLEFDVDITVHAGAVASYEGIRLVPELTDGVNRLEFPYIEIVGKHRRSMNERWKSLRSKKTIYEEACMTVEVGDQKRDTADTRLHYAMQAPYSEWMDKAQLVFHQKIIGYRSEIRLFTFSVGDGMKLTQREAYTPTFEVALITPAHEDKRRTKQGKAFLDFPVCQSVILPNYRRNPDELAKINAAFGDIQSNKDVQIMGLYVEGFASPDGRYTTNDRLARNRAFALKEYMKRNFGLPEEMFKVDYTAENWGCMRAMVEMSELAHKNEIVNIIDTEADPDVREAKIKAVCGAKEWGVILREMFPQLRRVEYQIDYSVRDFTLEECVGMVDVKGDLLSQLEFYGVAQKVGKQSPMYQDIMIERIPRYFPDDATALNNAAAVLIERGETATALRYLERAGDTPQVWNNIGVVYLISNRLDEAEAQFKKAAAGGVEQATYNLEQVQLKRADNIKMARYQNR